MEGFRFENPQLAWVLLAVPLLFLLFRLAAARRTRDLAKLGNPAAIKRLTRSISLPLRRLKEMLVLLGVLLLVVAAMRPQWGRRLVTLERRGIDIVFVIDVSRSMLAEDIRPNRLEQAKLQISGFLDRIEGDRVGLVVFAGSSFVSCPLTLDYNALKLFIDLISVDMVTRQGTRIGNALQVARTRCLEPSERSGKAIILLTDGEDHDSDPLEEAKLCAKDGIIIYTIGIGTRSGRPIPLRDASGNLSGYFRDRQGNVVMSALDEETLERIALTTQGKYYYSEYGELELDRIYEHLGRLQKKDLGSHKYRQREDHFQLPAAIALGCLFCEAILPDRRSRLKWLAWLNREEGTGRYE